MRWLGFFALATCFLALSGCSWISPAYILNLTGETLRIGGSTEASGEVFEPGKAYLGHAWCSKDIEFVVWTKDFQYEFRLEEIERFEVGSRDYYLVLIPESLNPDPAKRKFGRNARKR